MATIQDLLARTIQQGECRIWTGYINAGGYGMVYVDGKTRLAHRVVCELQRGPIPPGMQAMHSCDNRACIEPAHVSPGTPQANTDDMITKGRDVNPRGVQHGMSKLTPEHVVIIRERYAPYDRVNGASALAREFGVTQGTIWAAINGRTWAHV